MRTSSKHSTGWKCTGSTAVAFAYNYVLRGNVFSLRSGYDPTCQVKGAGSLLTIKAVEDSFDRLDWQYDLGPRHIECKRKLLTHLMPVHRLSCFKRWSVRQQLIRLKRNIEVTPILTPSSDLPILPVPVS